jgi:hypothetical protein
MKVSLNFPSFKGSINNLLALFTKNEQRLFYQVFSLVLILTTYLILVFFRLHDLPEKAFKFKKELELKKEFLRKKELLEMTSKTLLLKEAVYQVVKDVLNTQTKKELEFVTQFKSFESLKGHEGKLLLQKIQLDFSFIEKKQEDFSGYKQTEYELSKPLILNDLELKKLIEKLDEIKEKNPALMVNSFHFKKKYIEEKEKYEVNFTFLLREKKHPNTIS